MFQLTLTSHLSYDIYIESVIITYNVEQCDVIPVHISNVTTRTVTVHPNAILCEIQPVSVQNLLLASIAANSSSALDMISLPREELSEQEQRDIDSLLTEYQDIFSTCDTDIGYNASFEHHIDLYDDAPFRQRYLRIPPSMMDEVQDHIQQQLAAGIIRKSHSPFSSDFVLVRKKKWTTSYLYRLPTIKQLNQTWQLCLTSDWRNFGLSFWTQTLFGSRHEVWLSSDPYSRRTKGTYCIYRRNTWLLLVQQNAYGTFNAPATYQRLMEECLGDLLHRVCYVYLDDIFIFAKTFYEQQERLRMVFEKLKECGIKLSHGKCALFMKKVKYVCHVVSENGIEPDDDKVKERPRPTTSDEVRKFLGFVGYYRKFIQNFSKIATPLTDLIPTVSKTKTRKKTLRPVWKWEKEPFKIHTDASLDDLGGTMLDTGRNPTRHSLRQQRIQLIREKLSSP